MTIPFPEHAWPLMKQALQHIADHPSEFWMFEYLTSAEAARAVAADPDWDYGPPAPSNACGTVACLAGRITLMDSPGVEWADTETALVALDLHETSAASVRLAEVFGMDQIEDYSELQDALLERFTFPEPLPQPSVVTA